MPLFIFVQLIYILQNVASIISFAKIRLIALLIAVLLAFTACTKLCRSGYEGNRCEVLSRPKFEGQWNAIDTPGNLMYIDTISAGSGFAGLTISKNFANNYFSHPIYASANGININIASQQPDSNSYILQGIGTISGNDSMITWLYQITIMQDTPVTTNYRGIWTK